MDIFSLFYEPILGAKENNAFRSGIYLMALVTVIVFAAIFSYWFYFRMTRISIRNATNSKYFLTMLNFLIIVLVLIFGETFVFGEYYNHFDVDIIGFTLFNGIYFILVAFVVSFFVRNRSINAKYYPKLGRTE